MSFLPVVTHAEYRGGYQIFVRFNDKSERTIDFRAWLDGPVFEPLKDLDYFKKFFLDGGTIAWPNGADIAPEALNDYQEPLKRERAHSQSANTEAVATRHQRQARRRG